MNFFSISFHFILFVWCSSPSQQNQFIHELQQNLEQITCDKMNLEAEIIKMSSYKSEVMILQSEIMKLQVSEQFVWQFR